MARWALGDRDMEMGYDECEEILRDRKEFLLRLANETMIHQVECAGYIYETRRGWDSTDIARGLDYKMSHDMFSEVRSQARSTSKKRILVHTHPGVRKFNPISSGDMVYFTGRMMKHLNGEIHDARHPLYGLAAVNLLWDGDMGTPIAEREYKLSLNAFIRTKEPGEVDMKEIHEGNKRRRVDLQLLSGPNRKRIIGTMSRKMERFGEFCKAEIPVKANGKLQTDRW